MCVSELTLCPFSQREYLKVAQQFFQLVGGLASKIGTLRRNVNILVLGLCGQAKRVFIFVCRLSDTIPGRQCMASCFFLLRKFDDVLTYLNSVKVPIDGCVLCHAV